ncbi:hypothetical protein ACLBWX_03060 [Methylobacterium sp. M6A4_1b]
MRRVTTRLLSAAILCLPGLAWGQGERSPSGQPANLCRELVAFVQRPKESARGEGTPARLATAVTARDGSGTAAKPSAAGTPQNASGQSGQITASGPGAAGPQGDAQNRTAPGGSTATASGPVAEAPAAPAASEQTISEIRNLAEADDLRGCRKAAQGMRRAGIAMPGPLLALAAMAPERLGAPARP